MTTFYRKITLSLEEIEIIIAAMEDLISQSEENSFPATETALEILKEALL